MVFWFCLHMIAYDNSHKWIGKKLKEIVLLAKTGLDCICCSMSRLNEICRTFALLYHTTYCKWSLTGCQLIHNETVYFPVLEIQRPKLSILVLPKMLHCWCINYYVCFPRKIIWWHHVIVPSLGSSLLRCYLLNQE